MTQGNEDAKIILGKGMPPILSMMKTAKTTFRETISEIKKVQ